MIVKLESSLFCDSKYFTEIDRMIYFFLERRHDLFIDDEEVFTSDWQQEAKLSSLEIVEEYFERTVQGAKKPNIFIGPLNDIDNNIISIEHGYQMLNKPSRVFLENKANDSSFILSLLKLFKSKGRKALKFYEKGWLEFIHCGGKSDVINQLEEDLNFYNSYPFENFFYLKSKSLIIVDSDKKFPDDEIELNEKIGTFCLTNEIDFHILEKREMDNYLPISQLETHKNINGIKLDALKKLSPGQQDYYDLEKGFDLNSKSKLNPFYNDLNEGDFRILNKGFFPDFNPKTEIPKLFNSGSLTRESLLEKCSHQRNPNELALIIEKVVQIL